MGVNICACENGFKYLKEASIDNIKNKTQNDNTNIIITAEKNNIININITNQTNKSSNQININTEDDKKNLKKNLKKFFKENNQTMCVISKNNCSTTCSVLKDTINSNNVNLQSNLDNNNNIPINTFEKSKPSSLKKKSGFKKNIYKKQKEEDSESKETPIQDEEINLFINRNTDSNLISSSLSSRNDKLNNNDKNDENFSNSENSIFTFNFKSKKDMKYKFSGYIKKINEKKAQHIVLKPDESFDINTNSNLNNKTKLIKEGYGKIIFEDGSLFISNFKDNKINGFGKYEGTTSINNNNNKTNSKINKKDFFSNSDLLNLTGPKKRFNKRTITEEFIGEYINNKPYGFGIYTNFINNFIVIGNFGEKNWVGISSNEEYLYEGEFYNNKKHGIGTILWSDGITYQGQFLDNQMMGYGIINYPGIGIYKGNVKNGRLDGFGEFQWNSCKKYVGFYKEDKREGFGIFIFGNKKSKIVSFNENVSAYIGFWKQGNLEGLGIKVTERELKYGVWENGNKRKWLEDTLSVKIYLKNMSKKCMNLFLGTKDDAWSLVNKCIDKKEEDFSM